MTNVFKLLGKILFYLGTFYFKVKFTCVNPIHSEIGTKTIIVVVEESNAKWAYLKCPCGCHNIIMLSLNKLQHPSWSIEIDKCGRATIMPSIYRTKGCKSHFWIRNGNIVWVEKGNREIKYS